jgi:hypothetical protein
MGQGGSTSCIGEQCAPPMCQGDHCAPCESDCHTPAPCQGNSCHTPPPSCQGRGPRAMGHGPRGKTVCGFAFFPSQGKQHTNTHPLAINKVRTYGRSAGSHEEPQWRLGLSRRAQPQQ